MHALTTSQLRLASLWTWLPAFRAVAELQHVQRAAKASHITASSLSRALRLLEAQLGRQLFDRVGRNVVLNHDGEVLLEALRDGMRRIDEGLARVLGTTASGELRVAYACHAATLAAQALAALLSQHPDLRATLSTAPPLSSLVSELLRGEFDVAVVTTPPNDQRVSVQRVGELTWGIYCGAGHALARRHAVAPEVLAAHPFLATSDTVDGTDAWPPALHRTVRLRLPTLQAAVATCAQGRLLAVLPDLAVSAAAERTQLWRVPLDLVPSSWLHVVCRSSVGAAQTVASFVDELRGQLARVR